MLDVLEGGINEWIATFGTDESDIVQVAARSGNDSLCFSFPAALGDRFAAADPSPPRVGNGLRPQGQAAINRDKSGGGCG